MDTKNYVLPFFLFLAVSCIEIVLFFRQTDMSINAVQYTNNLAKRMALNISNIKNKNVSKLVLVYTPIFGNLPWPNSYLRSTKLLSQNDGKPCEKTCFLTYNKSDLAKSDAVLFHHRDLPSRTKFDLINQERNSQQRWIYYGQESPQNVYGNLSHLNGIFNWTVTYGRDSDVVRPYGTYGNITAQINDTAFEQVQRNYSTGKDGLVAWIISHCGTTRDKIVSKLSELLPISIYGHCAPNFPKRANKRDTVCQKNTQQCSQILEKFKFYLSFENSLCVDYITEKYWWTPFENNMVPIVFGLNYDEKNSIPGSYINIWDFPSLEALAEFLLYLDKNATAYNEYFQWKTKYERTVFDWECDLCDKLHSELPSKVYHNMKDFWGEETTVCLHEKDEEKLVGGLINGQ